MGPTDRGSAPRVMRIGDGFIGLKFDAPMKNAPWLQAA
jgi:hypothetical protein